MTDCGRPAVLIITTSLRDTATNIVRRRIELRCELEAGHAGPHRDSRYGEEWQARPEHKSTLFRHEDEDG